MNESLQVPLHMLGQFVLCSNVDECVLRLADDDRLAVAVSLKHALNSGHIPQADIYCFIEQQNLYNYPIAMFIPNNSALRSKINTLIQWSLEGGLFVKWAKDASRVRQHEKWLDLGIERNERRRYTDHDYKLTIDHIFFGLVVYGSGMVIALFFFLFEHVLYSKVSPPNVHTFWQWAEKFIDGKRYFLVRPDSSTSK